MAEPDNESERKGGGWGIGCGIVLLLGGGIMTLVTYLSAEPGGTYFVFWGAMVFGALAIIGGLMTKGGKQLDKKSNKVCYCRCENDQTDRASYTLHYSGASLRFSWLLPDDLDTANTL